jgi:GT2 family glycosyltransferase
MNKSHFGIVVLTYNHPDITSKCLDSLLAHVKNTDNITIVHNGSDLKNTNLIKNKYSQLHHQFLPTNIGYSGGANAGLKQAFQKYSNVLFLTNDIELLKLPETAPNGFNAVTIYKRNTNLIDSIYGSIDTRIGKISHLKEMTKNQEQHLYIPGTAFWIDRATFEELSGFDESYHTYWEDVDFSYRAQLKKIPLKYSQETVVKHKIGKTCHKNDFYTYYLFQRNRKKFMLKHGLLSMRFWLSFLFDITKLCKYRFHYFWRILND